MCKQVLPHEAVVGLRSGAGRQGCSSKVACIVQCSAAQSSALPRVRGGSGRPLACSACGGMPKYSSRLKVTTLAKDRPSCLRASTGQRHEVTLLAAASKTNVPRLAWQASCSGPALRQCHQQQRAPARNRAQQQAAHLCIRTSSRYTCMGVEPVAKPSTHVRPAWQGRACMEHGCCVQSGMPGCAKLGSASLH